MVRGERRVIYLQPLICIQLVWAEGSPHFIIQHFSCCPWQASEPSIFEGGQKFCKRPLQGFCALSYLQGAESVDMNIRAHLLAGFQDLEIGVTCMSMRRKVS